MKKIVNTEILAVKEYKNFVENPYPNSDFSIGRSVSPPSVLSNFVENLLLYDKVYIVTNSFEELITVKNWLSGHYLQELLHDGVIHFIQLPYAWCYVQKWKKEEGHRSFSGIANIFLSDKKFANLAGTSGVGDLNESVLGGWSNPDIEEAVAYTLTKFHGWNSKKVGKLSRLIAKNSTQLRSDSFRGFITKKTEEDLRNPVILESVGMSKDTDVENIPDNSQDIRKLFRLVLANQNMAVMQSMVEADLLAESFYSEALQNPLQNELKQVKLKRDNKELFELEMTPVPQGLGVENDLQIGEVIKLRNSKYGENFRKWIHENFESGEDVKAAYVQLLKKEPKFIYRLFNVVAPSLIGSFIEGGKLLEFAADSTIGGVSEFKLSSILERYVKPNPPKIFIDKVKRQYKKKEK